MAFIWGHSEHALPHNLTVDELRLRREELEEAQSRYVYESPETLPGIAFMRGPVDKMKGEMPHFGWRLITGLTAAHVVLNFSNFSPQRLLNAAKVLWHSIFVDQNDSGQVDQALSDFSAANDTDALAAESLKRFTVASLHGSKFEERNPALEPYRGLYTILEKPEIVDTFLENRVFARLRVAGYNPMTLFRVKTMSELPFEIDEAMLPGDDDTLTAVISGRRLYALDFSFLSEMEAKEDSSMTLVPSKSLFCVNSSSGQLEPVAIQLPGQVVYAPRPGSPPDTRWAIAQMVVNNGDMVHHELKAHFGDTHLLVEPFVSATMRQLPAAHPVHALLRPHFEGTVFINDMAARQLVAPGGPIDNTFGATISSMMAWAARGVLTRDFNGSMPDVEMARRGVDDPVLAFPYRDDALAHFSALQDWVQAYLLEFYADDAAVASDAELRLWAEELADPLRGRLSGFGDAGDGRVRTVQYLTRMIAFVIFSASAQHAAVNFPQKDLLGYAPAASGALWAAVPKHDEPAGFEEWQQTLPPVKAAITQLQLLAVIGAVNYTRLGNYHHGALPATPGISRALKTFKQRLGKIEAAIREREAEKEMPYEYMLPSKVPQSINI